MLAAGVSAVVISWVVSPVLSGIVAVIFFGFARTFILRSEDSYNRTFMFLPALVFICIFINAFFVLDKGVDKQCASACSLCTYNRHRAHALRTDCAPGIEDACLLNTLKIVDVSVLQKLKEAFMLIFLNECEMLLLVASA